MKKRSTELFIKDILDCIESIEAYCSILSFKDFLEDRKTQDAVLRNFEIIGEAIKNLPDDFRKNLPQIPWSEAARMRDLIAHHYFEVDYGLIWETIHKSLPPFKEDIKRLLK